MKRVAGKTLILVVDDEPAERRGLARLLEQSGYAVETAASGTEALAVVDERRPAAILADLVLPDLDAMELLTRLRATGHSPGVVVVTGHASIESAVAAMRRGAVDYLVKPIQPAALAAAVDKAVSAPPAAAELDPLELPTASEVGDAPLVGRSPAMQALERWIAAAASSAAPVLISGESGTGKELVARTIHDRSTRREAAFVAINCAAVPKDLLESELFGHEKGAFTGAEGRRAGHVEMAQGGTLMLDEVAEMESHTQAKLLRVLQDGTVRRVGGEEEIAVDFRVIAATNQDPATAIAEGRLREDLFYRLGVLTVSLPALRQRREDIPLLVRRFVDEINQQEGTRVRAVDRPVLDRLLAHAWPGNVRELRNAIHRAVVVASASDRDVLTVEDLPPEVQDSRSGRPGEARTSPAGSRPNRAAPAHGTARARSSGRSPASGRRASRAAGGPRPPAPPGRA